MAVSNKTGEGLFTVIMRDQRARELLINWVTTSRSADARVDDNNRLQIYNHNTLSLFMVTWKHSWSNITIWDVWSKRHIYLD